MLYQHMHVSVVDARQNEQSDADVLYIASRSRLVAIQRIAST